MKNYETGYYKNDNTPIILISGMAADEPRAIAWPYSAGLC
jgi:hypothetical protein